MKKMTLALPLGRDAGEQAILVEPLSGHTDEELVGSLEKLGASKVKILSPGFISARATKSALRKLHDIAHVHFKSEKLPHSD